MVNVLLLRQPSEDAADSYDDHFHNAGYHPFSLPALETFYVNLTVLSSILREGMKAKGFSGVIITSQRSCEALGKAFELLKDDCSLLDLLADWHRLPIYVVGEKTASCLGDIFARLPNACLDLIDIRGQDSGNAANLASFILSDVPAGYGTKLLYLTGDKNRDTITRMLSEGRIELEPLQVYRTQESPSFQSRLSTVLETAPKGATHWWIVYFAPSTASFVTPILKNYFTLQEISAGTTEGLENLLLPTRIAAIGPTTHGFLVGQLHLQVDAIARKPTPKDLVFAMENFDKSSP